MRADRSAAVGTRRTDGDIKCQLVCYSGQEAVAFVSEGWTNCQRVIGSKYH